MDRRQVILVVDDEVEICDTVKAVLALWDVDSVCFYDAESALAALTPVHGGRSVLRHGKDQAASLVCGALLDLNLPNLSGLELGERFHVRGMGIPFFLMTAAMLDADVEMRLAALRAGLLRKPFELLELKAAVDRFRKDLSL